MFQHRPFDTTMDPTNQLIRFSIPGSITVLSGLGTYLFAKVAWNQPAVAVDSVTTLTVAAIAISIPIGFLVYQLYYWGYTPFFLGGKFVTRDRGREALSALPDDVLGSIRTLFDARLDIRRHHCRADSSIGQSLKLLRLDDHRLRTRYKEDIPEYAEDDYRFEADDRNTHRIYSDNWYENWDVFRALLDLAATDGRRPEIKRNFATLYEIYHALGACRLGVVLGSVGGFAGLLIAHSGEVTGQVEVSIAVFYVVAIVTLFMAYVLHRTRIATWKSAVSKVRLDLRSCLTTDGKLIQKLPPPEGFTPRMNRRRGRTGGQLHLDLIQGRARDR